MDERAILATIKKWDKPAMRRLILDEILTPEMRLTDPRNGWRMPPIGHLIENIGCGAHEVFDVLFHSASWDPWAEYEIERVDEGERVWTTPVGHLIEFYVERRRMKASVVLFDALFFFKGLADARIGFNLPFRFRHVDEMGIPVESIWSELLGQSLCAVMLQRLPEPIEFVRHVLIAGGRFHASDPPGIFVLATFQNDMPFRQMRGRVDSIIDLLNDHRAHIEDEIVYAMEPISQRNFLHWMVAVSPWGSLKQSLKWLNVLHEYGLSVFTPAGDGRTVMELAASNPNVRDNRLIEALREMEKKERELYAMFATKHQVMHGLGLPREISERVQPYPKTWREREADTADWFYNRFKKLTLRP
jgi:hypothetical protein